MSYQEKIVEDRRLLILQALNNATGYRAPARLLMAFLNSMGHNPSQDQLCGDLAWLEEQGLVTLDAPTNNVQVATITTRGSDIAEGTARHPGVRRPEPGEQ